MWNQVQEKSITIYNLCKRTTIPNLIAWQTANNLIKMLDWLYSEFIYDAEQNPSCYFAKNDKKINVQNQFVIRNTSRIISYVNHAYLLEGIIKEMYKEMITKLKITNNTICEDTNKKQERINEIKNLMNWRNKVFSHTAYAYPDNQGRHNNPPDNLTMRCQSLDCLSSISFGPNGDSNTFTLGAAKIVLTNENGINENSSTELKPINLNILHHNFKKHIEEWSKMFIDTLEKANK